MRPHVRRTSRLLLFVLMLLAIAPSVGTRASAPQGPVACQAGPAPKCCCPKEKSLAGDCCCKSKAGSDCDFGSAPCAAEEGASAIVLAHLRAQLPSRLMLTSARAGFRAAPGVTRDALRSTAAAPSPPPPQSSLAS